MQIEEYIGDGVYIKLSEFGEVELYTDREAGRHIIFFDKESIQALISFLNSHDMLHIKF